MQDGEGDQSRQPEHDDRDAHRDDLANEEIGTDSAACPQAHGQQTDDGCGRAEVPDRSEHEPRGDNCEQPDERLQDEQCRRPILGRPQIVQRAGRLWGGLERGHRFRACSQSRMGGGTQRRSASRFGRRTFSPGRDWNSVLWASCTSSSGRPLV